MQERWIPSIMADGVNEECRVRWLFEAFGEWTIPLGYYSWLREHYSPCSGMTRSSLGIFKFLPTPRSPTFARSFSTKRDLFSALKLMFNKGFQPKALFLSKAYAGHLSNRQYLYVRWLCYSIQRRFPLPTSLAPGSSWRMRCDQKKSSCASLFAFLFPTMYRVMSKVKGTA